MHERATTGSASHEGYRAWQLGGGLAGVEGVAQRTSLALRAVQAPALTETATAAQQGVGVPLLPAVDDSDASLRRRMLSEQIDEAKEEGRDGAERRSETTVVDV